MLPASYRDIRCKNVRRSNGILAPRSAQTMAPMSQPLTSIRRPPQSLGHQEPRPTSFDIGANLQTDVAPAPSRVSSVREARLVTSGGPNCSGFSAMLAARASPKERQTRPCPRQLLSLRLGPMSDPRNLTPRFHAEEWTCSPG